MSYGIHATVPRPFEEVADQVRAALAAQGFGIVSEINMAQTLRNKLDVDIGDQVILGACSPRHAYRAIQAEPSIALLLPCNVVVRSEGSGTTVEMINPQMMVDLTDNPEMQEVADEVTSMLSAALADVAEDD